MYDAEAIAGPELRRSSRLTVDAARPSVRAMARTLQPCWRMLAIVIHSSG